MVDFKKALKDRERAMAWWSDLSLEEKFYNTIPNSHILGDDIARDPNTLTGREIQMLYLLHKTKP